MIEQAQPWELRDPLRTMTQKFNDAVELLNSLSDSSTTVNAATTEKLQELETAIDNAVNDLTKQMETKISEVSVADLGLDKVDNTSDIDKPVSTATQEAIDAAVEGMVTSEEIGEELNTLNLYGPEVSTPVKDYIENRLAELFNGLGGSYTPTYNIASADQLGVVKSGGDVTVNQSSGLLEIPKLINLDTLTQQVNSINESLETNNTATSKLVDLQGELTGLKTQDKTSIVAAINELYQMIQELDNQ